METLWLLRLLFDSSRFRKDIINIIVCLFVCLLVVSPQIFPKNQWVSWRKGILRLPFPAQDTSNALDDIDTDADIDIDHQIQIQSSGKKSSDVSVDNIKDKEQDEDDGDLVPTGEVVCIINSPSRDLEIVAAFPSRVISNISTTTNITTTAATGVIGMEGRHPSGENNSENLVSGKEEFVLVTPVDKTLPKFRICTRQKVALLGKKVALRIDNWNRDSQYPNAHITRHLGANGDFKTEIEALFMKNNISIRPFSSLALSCLPIVNDQQQPSRDGNTQNSEDIKDVSRVSSEWKISDIELQSRKDLRTVRNIFRYDLLTRNYNSLV